MWDQHVMHLNHLNPSIIPDPSPLNTLTNTSALQFKGLWLQDTVTAADEHQ